MMQATAILIFFLSLHFWRGGVWFPTEQLSREITHPEGCHFGFTEAGSEFANVLCMSSYLWSC